MGILDRSKNLVRCYLVIACLFCILLTSTLSTMADVDYELTYQDPAGDVLGFNETWHSLGSVDTFPNIDFKWLKSYNDTEDNVVLRLEVRNKQEIERSNSTRYVFRVFTKQDNSTGYNVTFRNGITNITDFEHTIEDDLTNETSIINENGEILLVKISKNKYLSNITHFNIDAFTWKEEANHTYIDYISEVPGHPEATGDIVDTENGKSEDEGILDMLCSQLFMILIVLAVIVIIIIIIIKRR